MSERIDAITAASIRDALKAIRAADSLKASPLINLALVESSLRAEGVHVSPESRAWMLGRILEQRVWEALGRLRGNAQPTDREEMRADQALQLLVTDFRAGQIEREAWSVIHTRFLSHGRPSVALMARELSVVRRTLERRASAGYELLADALRDAEYEALQQADHRQGASTAERILVTEDEVGSSEDEALGPTPKTREQKGRAAAEALRAALMDGGRVVRLSKGEVEAIQAFDARNLDEQRLQRIAVWSRPRFRLDTRFIALSLLLDRGEDNTGERWSIEPLRFEGLEPMLDAVDAPAFVLLGPPGSGKSTLLRRLELDLAAESLRRGDRRATFFVPLSQHVGRRPTERDHISDAQKETEEAGATAADRSMEHDPGPDPSTWLSQRWSARYPGLPDLASLVAAGRVTLLLDGLNELPHRGPTDYRRRILAWKALLQRWVAAHPENRFIVSCRSLDYSAPLSGPDLRIPQVRIEAMDDERLQGFLHAYFPEGAARLWKTIASSDQLDLLRLPYHLLLLIRHYRRSAEVPQGRAAIFTGFARHALRRELERDNPLFLPNGLLTERDVRRVVTARRWRTPWELPSRGALFPGLSRLAQALQRQGAADRSAQLRTGFDEAAKMAGDRRGEAIVQAGLALSVLDEDRDLDEIMFFHQLLQEYFAARAFVESPEPRLVRPEALARDGEPTLAQLLEELGSAEALPPMPQTGWEETVKMAAEMTEAPDTLLRQLLPIHPVLAGECAAQASLIGRVGDDTLDELRSALVAHSRDRDVDLRERISAGAVLGQLGDPRLERRQGPMGMYLLPPMVEVPAGEYPIGDDAALSHMFETFDDHAPRHRQRLAAYTMSRFAVTNAEWACFMDAGGYEDEALWETEEARAWRRGATTEAGAHFNVRNWLELFEGRPGLLEEEHAAGRLTDMMFETWQRRLEMDEREFAAHLEEQFPNRRATQPNFWDNPAYNAPSQPVIGICWYEARAYCAWLSAQTGRRFRLPTEIEWEAAARGCEGRRFAYGDEFDALSANTRETHLQRPTPVGVFPEGDSPFGLCDLTGNTFEWTSTAWGLAREDDRADFPYPYRADDGRENPFRPAEMLRVVRGGSWYNTHELAITWTRLDARPDDRRRISGIGLRLVATPDPD